MRLCTIADCDRPLHATGLCGIHYSRKRKYGSPEKFGVAPYDGRSKTPLYNTHVSMLQRCYNSHNKRYANYGGRGIKVCARWLGIYGFSNFLLDMGERPKGMSIDRINNDGDYEPTNCRWATLYQQAQNQGKLATNTSGYKGVSWHKQSKKWQVRIERDGKTKYLGRFNDVIEAADAYEYAAISMSHND